MAFLHYSDAVVANLREGASQFVGTDTAFPAYYVHKYIHSLIKFRMPIVSLHVHQPCDMRSLNIDHHECISGDGIGDQLWGYWEVT